MPRGGKRPGAGRKPKSLVDKLADGNVGHRPIKTLKFKGSGKPECPDYLKQKRHQGGMYPSAEEVFNQVADWLEMTGCVHLVPPDWIAEFAILKTRWMEAEARVDMSGFLAKHPISGNPITSPYIKAGIEYLKQAEAVWDKIWKIVTTNSSESYIPESPGESLMSNILAYGAVPQPKKKKPKKEAPVNGTDEHPEHPD